MPAISSLSAKKFSPAPKNFWKPPYIWGIIKATKMASQVFYRKWRPQTFAEVVGQEPTTRTLINALTSGRVSHAYLFCGPRGTGKTSTGRILAKAVNCLTNGQGEPCNTCIMCQAVTEGKALDVIEIDAASNRGIDDIRELRERVNYAPNQARYKVYIIDEVHMLSKDAANALLKTLEEPPPHVIFVLATTEAHKVLPTMLSRCQRFNFRRLSRDDVVSKLTRICQAENIDIDPEGLQLIAKSTTGSLRDAENLLEQLTTYYGSRIELQQIQSTLGITGDWRIKELVKHIVNGDVSAGITTLASVNSDGLDLKQFNRELVEYLRGLLLIKTGSTDAIDLTADDLSELKDLAAQVSLSQILRAVKLFGQLELGFDSYSTLPLELALVDCALPPAEEEKTATPQTDYELRQPVSAAAKPAPKPVTPQPPPVKPEPPAAQAEPVTAIEPEPVATPEAAVEPEPAATPEAAVEPEPVATPEAAIEPEPGSEVERLIQNWRRIIEEAPPNLKKTTALAILRSADVRPVAIEADTVVLCSKFDFFIEQIEKPENQRVAVQIISSFLGRPCRVRCIHKPENNHLLRAALRMGAQVTSVEEK